MAVGSRARGASGGRPRSGGPAPAPGLDRNQLAARLRAIAESVPSPEEAFEPMVRVVLEATGATAGAVCLYDVHHRLLRLAAEVGLSDEGCQKLRMVKQGNASSWDMPLHGLLNRRAYLIENAASNRFVPPLVDDTAAMSAVACLPLYEGATPLASFILIALAPHTLAEGHLHAIEGPLAEMGRVIETIRQRAQGRSETSAAPAAPAGAAPVAATGPTPERHETAADEIARLTQALAQLENERDALAAALETRLDEQRTALEAAHAAASTAADAERAHLATERDAARAEAARLTAAAEAARVDAERATALVREHQDRALHAAAATPDRHTDDDLQRALDAAREAADARDRAIGELATLRTELASAATSTEGLTHELTSHRSETERLTAQLHEVSARRDEIDRALADARQQSRETATRLAETERALQRLQDEHGAELALAATRLAEREADLQALRDERAGNVESLTARAETLSVEADRLREAHAALATERDRLAADLADARHGHEQIAEALRDGSEQARLRAEADATRLAEQEAETAVVRGRVDELTARVAEHERALADARQNAETEAARLAAQDRSLDETRQRTEAQATALAERERALAEAQQRADVHAARLAELERALAEREQALGEARRLGEIASARVDELEAALAAAAERADGAAAHLLEHERERAEAERRAEASAARVAELERALGETQQRAEESAARLAEHARALDDAQERAETDARRLAAQAQELDEARVRATTDATGQAEDPEAIAALRLEHAAETAALHKEIAALTDEREQLRTQAPEASTIECTDDAADEAAPATGDGPTFEPCPHLIVVLDDDGPWQGVTVDRYDLMVIPPAAEDDIAARLAPSWPGRVIANLAAPGAVKALLALRATGAPTRMWGCIANGAGDHALALGAIEPAARPLAPEAVLASLASHLPPGGRVVTVGADVDALLSLRQALARQGMSVSLAWDAKQANELLEMVRPDVVVADLGAPDDVCAVVTRLATSDPVPTTVLIEGASDVAKGFAAILGSPAVKAQLTDRRRLLGAILERGPRKPGQAPRPR